MKNPISPKTSAKAKGLRILLAEDHLLFRAGLRSLLSSRRDMHVVAEASNGEETVRLAQQFRPDVILMDLSMPGMNGLQATQVLKTQMPEVKILVLTSHRDESYFRALCRSQASGYVLKSSVWEELLVAIRQVTTGRLYFDAELAAKALTRQPEARSIPSQTLSEREEEVLRAVALGYTNKEVGNLLGLSVKTVETHKARICEKLNFRGGRVDMVQYALRQGWLDQTRSNLLQPLET